MAEVEQKVVVLTGASRGIGHATVKRFGAEGWRVITCSRQPFDDRCPWPGGAQNHIQVDLADPKQTIGAIDEIKARLDGKLHALINNAGIFLGKDINNVSMEEYQKVISINLTGVYLGIKYLTPLLVKAGEKSIYGSSIINLSSVAGLKGSPIDPLYSMTKGGITTFTKSMAIYYGRKNIPIRINQVHPGIIETDMGTAVSNARLTQNPKMTSEESYLASIAQTPLGRLGTAEEVAKTILFLSSDDSSFMTGSSLVVDGGFTA